MSKQRLTITLAKDIVTQIDQLIDGKTIRNRSHAIEHLVSKSLKPEIDTALILAGGSKDESRDTIRPLTIINDKPLIQHTLEHLHKFGVSQVVIATSRRGQAIQDMVGDGQQLGLSITYLYEDEPLGTAGAIKHAQDHLEDQPFFVWSGDVLTDINLHDLASFHRQHQTVATISVKPRASKQLYDNVFMQGDTIVDFQPAQDHQQVSIVNSGVYLFDPEIFELLSSDYPQMLEQDVFPQLIKQQNCVAFVFQGMWFDIESDQNYQQALTKEAS
jgi:NDP-sugar pyrophosphorylase family protein